MGKHNRWSQKETDFLLEHKDKSNAWIAAQLGRGRRTVVEHRSKLNSPRTRGYRTKYKERQNIELFALGWAVGLFATDGSATINRKNRSPVERVALSLSSKDHDTVVAFFNLLLENFSAEDIVQRVDINSLSSSFKSRYICTMPKFMETVREYLTFSSKTYDMSLTPKFFQAQEQFKLGLLRGVIDGDGWVKKDGRSISITSASLVFLEGLSKEFNGKITKRKSGNYWDLRFRVEEIQRIKARGLLLDTTLPMKRKTKRLIGDKHVTH